MEFYIKFYGFTSGFTLLYSLVCVYSSRSSKLDLVSIEMSTVVKILIVAVVVTSTVLTSAQPTSQSSSQCNMTYNATFESKNRTLEDLDCSSAFWSSLIGSATDEQKMMLCNAGQCNTRIENVISACSNTVRSYV